MYNFDKTLLQVLKVISQSFRLNIIRENELNLGSINSLFEANDKNITYFDEQIRNYMINGKSKLSDAFVDFGTLKDFCNEIAKKSSNTVLNHLGLCYQVASKELERKRLKEVATQQNMHLYEMLSSDSSLWLFLGDKSSKDPLVELLPVEKVKDYYLDYWLPHFQINLNTNLTVDEIKYMTHTLFKGTRSANPSVVINDVIYQSRIWLGTFEGTNVVLDLSTNQPENSFYKTHQYLKTLI